MNGRSPRRGEPCGQPVASRDDALWDKFIMGAPQRHGRDAPGLHESGRHASNCHKLWLAVNAKSELAIGNVTAILMTNTGVHATHFFKKG
jgi:hypothetical protein